MPTLIDLGYEEIKPGLYMIEIGNVRLYHDFRKGKRWSYAFDDKGSVDVHDIEEYKRIKMLEEAKKVKTLDKFDKEM